MKQALVNLGFAGMVGFTVWAGRAPETASAPSSSLGFRLREISKSAGIDFVHRATVLDERLAPIMPHVAGMGAAVSVADVNGDGWVDLYATSSAFGTHNALFVNQRDGTFRDQALEAGVGDVNRPGEGASMGSIFGDVDGDGDEDMFLYKWGYPQLFRNDGGTRFTDVTQESGLRRWINSNAAVFLDFDRDGALDLYVAGYFRDDVDLWQLESTKIMQESFEFANNGGHKHLYRNLGDGRFVDVTAEMDADSTRWTLAVAAADLDGDGWQDLFLANDYGSEELLLNRGGRKFERARDAKLEGGSKSGMSVTLGDVQNDGRLALYVTNISKAGYLFQGNNLWLNRLANGGWVQNVADGVVADCGWAWGAQFGDLDNDARVDLYVVNGFVSANRERDYWYGMSKVAVGLGNLAEDAANWPPMEDRSLSGYERSRVLVNQGRGRFVDVAAIVGADDLFDGRAVTVADLFNRGALDVVVANQKGPLLVYRNEVAPDRHWLQLRLRGSGGNTSAIGALVTLHYAGERQAQSVEGSSGFCSQKDRRLHFGLGAHAAVDRVHVRWPSGREQTIEAPRVDTLHEVREP
ncbi:MAG: CRTAC1 family protein [Planctomycetota bacterium]